MEDIRRVKPLYRSWALLIMLAITVLAGCQAESPIKVGFIAGTSGRVADLGISGRDAAQLAIEQCNQEGGIAGRKIQLIIKDDEQSPALARNKMQELVAAGLVAVIGPMTSDMGIAISPIADASETLLISPTVTTHLLSGKDDYLFRVTSTTRDYAAKSARYQIASGNVRSIAAAYDLGNKSFCESWLNSFVETFTAGGGEVRETLGYRAGADQSFLEIAQKLLTARPDGILIIANSMDSALLCQQIRKLDSDIAITLADWGATERLLELGGRAVEDVTVVQTFDRNSKAPDYQAFRKIYMDHFQREPGFPGVYTYDAVQVLLTALRMQKTDETLKQTILSIRRFKGLQSEFSFDDFGDVKRPHASISVIRNGRFVVVE